MVAVNCSRDSLAWLLRDVPGQHELAFPLRCGPDDGAGQDVPRHLVQARGQAQDLPGRPGAGRDDRGDSGLPAVRVPVLSSNSVVHWARRSSTPPFFTTTPRCAAAERPETSATGAASMSGQGVATTRTATARAGPPSTQAAPATARVSGRNHSAYRSASRTNGACVFSASEVHQADDPRVGAVRRARDRAQVERAARVQHAAADAVPDSPLGRQRLTGERGLSTATLPATAPSTGTTSPGATISTSPGTIRSSGTVSRDPSRYRRVVLGARASRARRLRWARSAAQASSARPLASMTLITAAASTSPTAIAPASASSAMTSTPIRPGGHCRP